MKRTVQCNWCKSILQTPDPRDVLTCECGRVDLFENYEREKRNVVYVRAKKLSDFSMVHVPKDKIKVISQSIVVYSGWDIASFWKLSLDD